ncbi:MAG: hypothetical protein Q8P53_02370 [Candidatus Shapirobacteria bacterium]|nr:hypothetical protein [Candidatus Shapirobacteria bacterium]
MSIDENQKNTSTQPTSLDLLINTMKSVDVNSEEAKANATSIKDSDGKRIKLDDDPKTN